MYLSGVSEEGQPQYATDENQITNGLYSAEDEDGVSYYYRGNVDNNYVQFGEYTSDYYVYNYGSRYFQSLASCQEYNSSCSESNRVKLASAGDKMYWKIVRVNGDGSLRLIYNGTSANPTFAGDIDTTYVVGISPYNLEINNPKYAGYTYDNGTDSFIKKEVDTWYKNALGNTAYDSKVIGGRFCSDSSGYREETMLGNVFASFDRLAPVYGKVLGLEMQENVTPTLKCPSTTENYGGSYRLKAGLITADELALVGESSYVLGNSYLNPGESDYWYWSMTPAAFFNDFASVWNEFELLINDGVYNDGGSLRPVINVTTDNGFTSGDGTVSNPYVIS